MECLHLPELSYMDFTDRLEERLAGRRIPLSGSIELTERCNLRCVHCYINQPVEDIGRQARELTFFEWDRLLGEIADEGCLWLLLTGGEIFVRPDALRIYETAKRKGLLITLFTNGTTITQRIADFLAEWPPTAIEITIYGATERTFEAVTRTPGSYRNFLQGIERLVEHRLPVKLKTTAMTLNHHELSAMQEFADLAGLDFRIDPLLTCRADGQVGPAKLRLSPEDVLQIDMNDPRRRKEWHEFCDRFLDARIDTDHLYACAAGVRSFHIDAHGQLSMCLIARQPAHDLRVGSFHDGWHSFLATVRTLPAPRDFPCNRCAVVALCGQCPGWSQLEHGPTENARPVAYLHQVAQMRAKAFGLKMEL